MNQKTNILKCMRKRSRASEIQGRGLDWSRSLICNANLNGNIFFFSTCWLDLRRQERLMNDYRNQEAEAQGEKDIFFFNHMNSDGIVPAQSPRWNRGLVPVQFWSLLKPAADLSRGWSCSCGAFGGKLGIFSTNGFTVIETDGTGQSSRAAFSHLAHVACVRLYTFSICCPLG